ncbi:putative 37S ribosomal protein S24, mitochondrial [Amylocarpus encephaloides]|uniref:37S ribosomal protein S24, mitochondrial n=1 Tax=Amylocarpus encephaloides TaxID=45428 RepID=A0A9P7YQG4_9HELO|nr:putative 37S ribosomal protein S24, mitochondrial [Amylocarpus encephaloides]
MARCDNYQPHQKTPIMATALQGLYLLAARSCSCSQISYPHAARSIGGRRLFSTTPAVLRRIRGGPAEDKAALTSLAQKHGLDLSVWDAENERIRREIEEGLEADIDYGPAAPDLPFSRKKLKETFLNMGEQEPFEDDGFMEDDQDDVTSIAHRELEQHREWRHYARLAAWEMPLLSKLAKPFKLPSSDMPLRFRYTTYMGEHHPAEKKVVLQFTPSDIPNLTPIQRMKLRKLLGTRFNPEKDTARMSCEMYETQAQNKRYLGDLVESLIAEARDPKDTFEDVPLDTRHHQFKPKLQFPKEWIMKEDRKRDIEIHREKFLLKDRHREALGLLVDGSKVIHEALKKAREEPQPETLMAGKGGKALGKGGRRLAIKR